MANLILAQHNPPGNTGTLASPVRQRLKILPPSIKKLYRCEFPANVTSRDDPTSDPWSGGCL